MTTTHLIAQVDVRTSPDKIFNDLILTKKSSPMQWSSYRKEGRKMDTRELGGQKKTIQEAKNNNERWKDRRRAMGMMRRLKRELM